MRRHDGGIGGAMMVLAFSLTVSACGVNPDANVPGEEPAAPLADAVLDLQASGIIVPAQNGFEQLDVPFGSNREGTEATLAAVLGDPVAAQASEDCRLTVVQFDGLSVSFDGEGDFVGYYATQPYLPEQSRSDMLADPAVAMVEGSTLGDEFTIGDPQVAALSGLFSGPGADAGVTALWAGENCMYR